MSLSLCDCDPRPARTPFITGFFFLTLCAGHTSAAQCKEGWQVPRALVAADGRPAYVESPVAVPELNHILLLGIPALLWAERNNFDAPPSNTALDTAAYLARLGKNHGLVGFMLKRDNSVTPLRPPNAAPMRKLVAVSNRGGTVHLVWFSPGRNSTGSDVDGEVWYAERRAAHWTASRRVFSADRVDWSGQKAALLVGHHSDIHLVLPYYRGQVSGIAYIRRLNGRWITTETRVGGLPSQATAQFIGTDSLAIGFARVGVPGIRVRNGQHVYLIRAALSDTVWPAATLVHYSGLAGVRWLEMFRGPLTKEKSETLTLVWKQMPTGSRSNADTVYAMVSENGGVTWRSPETLALPFKVTTMARARDTMGNVHIVVTSSDLSGATNTQIYHAALGNGKWGGMDSVLAGPVASAPTLSLIKPHTLLLVWGNARPGAANNPHLLAPVSKYAILVSACPPLLGR
jgi:hypothetical protein